MIGLDTAKASFQVQGVNEEGHAELKRKLRRSEVIAFFEAQPACTVVLEACGAAHHWGRVLSGLGHTLKLVAPEAVRPFVKRGRKNDAADAAALCEAARRPEVKFVPVKSQEQQATLALHTARALLVKQQIMLANAMRSLGAEFGLVVPQGLGRLGELVALMEVDAGVPETAGQALQALHQQLQAAREVAARLEAALVAHARQDETARRLATIPGVGPACSRARDTSRLGSASSRASTPRAARRAWAGSRRRATRRSASSWCSAPPRWCAGPGSGTARLEPGSGAFWRAARPGWRRSPWPTRPPASSGR
jgi:error-prone DNA polymerase